MPDNEETEETEESLLDDNENDNDDDDGLTDEERDELDAQIADKQADVSSAAAAGRKKSIKRLKFLTKANRYLQQSKKILNSAVKIATKPHPVIIVNEVLTHANAYVNKQAAGHVIGNKGWNYVLGLPDNFALFLWQKLALKGEVDTMTTSTKIKTRVKVTTVYGIDFRYIARDRELMYADGSTIEEVTSVLGRVVIEDVGPRYKVTRQIELTGRRGNGVFRVLPMVPEKIYPSKMGDELIVRLRPFLQKGINRSVFLCGEPGTGKTCMTEYLSENLGHTCLTFESSELFQLNVTQMRFILTLLKPDTLIVNDIDRSMGNASAQVLGILEMLSKHVILTVVTANTAKLAPAALRPGRFDEVIYVKTLGEDTIRTMLEGFPPSIYKQVHNWPAAFINELVVRAKTLGMKNLKYEIAELQSRVDLNGGTDGVRDNTQTNQVG